MRLDQLTKAELSAEQDELYDALIGGLLGATRSAAVITDEQGYVQGPFTVMLYHPTVGHPVQDLGTVLRFRGSLPDRARELVILVVAAHWHSDFEWWAHERIGRNVGLTDAEIDALRTGAPLTVTDPVDQAALDTARALVQRADLNDVEHARAQDAIGDEQLVEVTALVGYYAMLALQMRVFRIAAPDGVTFA
jgi:4-carboxymuconolactone decarboxylase